MDRQGFIGGSDLYSIMRGDWLDLWLVKTGEKEPDDLDNIFKVRLGTFTEPFNIAWFCKDTDSKLISNQKEFTKTLRDVPFKGTVDAIVQDNLGRHHLLECKHTSNFKTMKDMLETYMPQIQLYMHLADLNSAYLSVIHGNEFSYTQIGRDTAYLSSVVDRCAEFWKLVTDGITPMEQGPMKIDWSKIKIDGLKIRDASKDNHFIDLAHTYCNLANESKRFDAVKKELRSMIADDEREVFCDLLTIKRDKRGACRITVHGGTDEQQ